MKKPANYRDDLAPLVGKWGVTITNMLWMEDKQAELTGTANIGWTDLNLLRYVQVMDGGEVPDSISVIGYDHLMEKMDMLYTDERGVCRIYQMSVEGNTWKYWREGDPFNQRFEGRISDDGKKITAYAEKLPKDTGEWERDFDIIFTKVS